MLFASLAIGGFIAFIRYGADILSNAADQAADNNAYIPRLLEVAVPIFMAIWVLRIVGRMLSTHLNLWEEAGERATMVKTFLAFMREDRQGGPLVQDQDRILILNALFRHSTTSGADDSPPASWFDLLMTRLRPPGK